MPDETIFAKPAAGVSLPLPDGTPWPAEGARVPLTQYVRRCLAAGDLVVVEQPSSAASPLEGEADARSAAGGGSSDAAQAPPTPTLPRKGGGSSKAVPDVQR